MFVFLFLFLLYGEATWLRTRTCCNSICDDNRRKSKEGEVEAFAFDKKKEEERNGSRKLLFPEAFHSMSSEICQMEEKFSQVFINFVAWTWNLDFIAKEILWTLIYRLVLSLCEIPSCARAQFLLNVAVAFPFFPFFLGYAWWNFIRLVYQSFQVEFHFRCYCFRSFPPWFDFHDGIFSTSLGWRW